MKVFTRSAVLIIVLIGIAVMGVVAALNLRTPPKVQKRAEPTLSVRTLELLREVRRPALFLIGRVEARNYATLNMPIEADVLQIAAREGEYFDKNAQLVEIDVRELQYMVDAQQAQLDELHAQLDSINRNRSSDGLRLAEAARLLELAKKDYTRNRLLFDRKVLPLKQLEQAEQTTAARQSEFTAMENQVADYDTQERRLQAQIAAANAQLEQTRLLMERAALRAPFAGRVAKVHTAVGARAGRGAALLDIFAPTDLRLRVAIAQRYAQAVKGGNVRAIVSDHSGRLTLSYAGIQPRVEAGNSSIDTFFSLPAGDWVLGAVRDVVVELPPVESAAAPVDAIYNDRFIYRVGDESRAEAVECERFGLTRGSGGQPQVLIHCPTLADSDKIVADQLPSMLNGVLLKVINGDR